MTPQHKIEKILKAFPGISLQEAKKQVRLIDWLTKWEPVLVQMRTQYQAETGGTESQMEFNMFIYQTNKHLPFDFERRKATLN